MDTDTLAKRLKWVREARLDVSQPALAEMVTKSGQKVTGTTVMRYENGEREPPAGYVAAVARVSRVDAGWLLSGECRLPNGEDAAPEEREPPYNESREEQALAKIDALPGSLLRTLERESMAAVIRAQGMRDACRAARIEAEKAPTRGLPQGVSSDAIERAWKAVETLANLGVIQTSGSGGAMSTETREPPPSRPADETQ